MQHYRYLCAVLGKTKLFERKMDGECLGLAGEESNGQEAENTKEILDDGLLCVGLRGMGS